MKHNREVFRAQKKPLRVAYAITTLPAKENKGINEKKYQNYLLEQFRFRQFWYNFDRYTMILTAFK